MLIESCRIKLLDTSGTDVNTLIDEVATGIGRVLEHQLVGLYLYGSLVTGGFDADVSDIDLLAVTASDVDASMLERLRAMHAGIAERHPAWDDRIEVAYLSRAGLRTFRQRRTRMGIISPGEPLHYRSAGLDWLMNWYLVREHGRAIVGPKPAELIAPISDEEFIESLREHARWRAATMGDVRGLPGQSYAVLTMCRTLRAHRTGELVSKTEAAAWTANAFPEWSGLMDNVLTWRRHAATYGQDDSPARPEVLAFVHMVDAAVSEA